MNGIAVNHGREASSRRSLSQTVVVASYGVLGLLLVWSRFVGLGRGYASDELMTVRDYVTRGPREILAGAYVPNNHELFSLLGWTTRSIVGDSEIALRLWSAAPFVVGVVLVTAWLHVRLGPLTGLLFLGLATLSPLLLDITRQARGYGLAFLAMAGLTLAALELVREPRTWLVAAFCGAGVLGTLTLPHFGVAFAAMGVVLLGRRAIRRPVVIGLGISLLAILAWYAPHLNDLLHSSRQEYGSRIEGAWIVTAPVDQILLPGLRWIDETLFAPGIGSLVFAVVLLTLIGSSPLLRERFIALVLVASPIAMVVALWLTHTNVAPRFFSFLLVPLFMLLASGIAAIFARSAKTKRVDVRTVIAATTLGLVVLMAAPQLRRITQLPREATSDVAAAIQATAPSAPVVTYMPYPHDLELLLGRPVTEVWSASELRRACRVRETVAIVTQPWILPPAKIPCIERQGTRHFRFRQYARGGQMDLWLVTPAA